MAGALRKLFVELDIKVNKSPLDETVKGLSSFFRTLNRLKKIGTKNLEKSLQKTDKNLHQVIKSGKKVEKSLKDSGKSGETLADSAKKSKKEFRGLESILGGVAQGIAQAITTLGLSGLRSFIEDTVESTSQLARWSARLQIGARDLESWVQLSSQFGADIDDVTDAFKELQLKARDALDGTKTYQDVFKIIGISSEDLQENVNNVSDLMDLFTTRLMENTDAATQSFVVDELMNDAGTRMLEVFRMGTNEIGQRRGELLQQNEATEQLITVNGKFIQAIAKLGIFFTNLRNKVLVHVLPVLTSLVTVTEEVSKSFAYAVEHGELLTAAFLVVGAAGAKSGLMTLAAWAPVIATWAFWVVGIIAAILLLEDLIVTLEGGDSALKHFLKDIGLWGDILDLFDAIGDAWDWIVEQARQFVEIWEEIFAFFAPMQQFFWTISGLGATAGEIQGEGRVAESRRRGARSAEQTRRVTEQVFRDRGGVPGTIAAAGINRVGAAQRTRAGGRRQAGRVHAATQRSLAREAVVQETAEQHIFSLFGPEENLNLTSVPEATRGNIRVEAPSTVTVNITEAQNPDEIRRIVGNEISTRNNEQVREIQNALVPESRR